MSPEPSSIRLINRSDPLLAFSGGHAVSATGCGAVRRGGALPPAHDGGGIRASDVSDRRSTRHASSHARERRAAPTSLVRADGAGVADPVAREVPERPSILGGLMG